MNVLDLRDELVSREFFTNGISGRTCHPDSYMAVADYNGIIDHVKASEHPRQDWLKAADIWSGDPNSPVFRIVGAVIKSILERQGDAQ